MKYYLFGFLFFVAVYLLPLGMRPLVMPDEFRYSVIPREMIASGDYLTPRLLGYRYFEKPSFGYYLTAASFKVFGENPFALRFPAALGAGLAAAFLAILVAQTTKDDKLAALSGVLYLSCGMVGGLGNFAVLDSQLAAAIAGSFTAFFLASEERNFSRRKFFLLLCAGAGIALTFWIKGFVGLAVIGVTMAAYLLWQKDFKSILTLPWIPFAVALAIILPWAISIHRAEPDFWRYFICEEHLNRFLSKTPGQHPEPFWFLWPFLLAGMFPAGFFAIAAVGGIYGHFKELCRIKVFRFGLCGLFMPMIFFSFSSGKLPTYILPCYFFFSILLTLGWAKYMRSGSGAGLFFVPLKILGYILLIGGIAGAILMFPQIGILQFGNLWLAAVAAGMWGAMLVFFPKKSWSWQFAGFFAGLAMTVQAILLTFPWELLTHKVPEAALIEAQKHFDLDNVIIVTSPTMMHAVSHVYGKRPVLLTSTGEIDYGVTKYTNSEGIIPFDKLFEWIDKLDRKDILFISRGYDDEDVKPNKIKKMFHHSNVYFILY